MNPIKQARPYAQAGNDMNPSMPVSP